MSEPELQLLVIDLGDCCVVKVEKGDGRASLRFPRVGWSLNPGITFLVHHTFVELREAIEQKPVPRIEQNGGGYALRFRTYMGDSHKTFTPEAYKALSQLVGKPLPVWKGGKWTRLPKTSEYIGDPLDGTGVKIWRYRR